jgi:hypothetical protein
LSILEHLQRKTHSLQGDMHIWEFLWHHMNSTGDHFTIECVRRLIWVGEVVYTGVGIVNEPNHEYLELKGAVGNEESGTVCTGRMYVEEAVRY